MRLFDVHSHWGTRRGYPLQTEEELAHQRQTWGSVPRYDTEEEMADYLRCNGVRAILDFGFTKYMPLARAREHHDYAIEMQRRFPDAIAGIWIQIDPRNGEDGAAEVLRCIGASEGFVGVCVSGSATGFAASDEIYAPLYDLSQATQRPVLVLVGHTGGGAGLRGGKGFKLDLCHPRYIDELAILYPDLRIIAGRPAWPWQDEMISVMLHKPNVWSELHGWSPKYLTDPLRKEIRRRLTHRTMFGADYPLFRYERLVADWRSLGFEEEVLERVFHANAEALFSSVPSGKAAAALASKRHQSASEARE